MTENSLNPLVSVIMPTYNHAEYIEEAINSVIHQSFENFELIIVDNFSTDATEKIVTNFTMKDERIKYFKFSNSGVIAASRNHGIEKSKGKYLAFIDSDDQWTFRKLELQVACFQDHPEGGLISGRFQVKSQDNFNYKVLGPKNISLSGNIYADLLKSNFITSSSVMARADVVRELKGFDEDINLRCSEDFDLWLRIARNYDVYFLADILGFYRKHASNLSSGGDSIQKAINVVNKHERLGYIDAEQSNRAKANFMIHEAWVLIDTYPKKAREHLTAACKLSKNHFKFVFICNIGMLFSHIPFVFSFIRRHNIDRKIANLIMNPQNI